ncbi:MAG: restriction endonuclease subunit S [Candidatus Heimdallarchaeaceae archaeon]
MSKEELPEGWDVVELYEIVTTLENGKRPKGGVKHILKGIPSIGAEFLADDDSFNKNKARYIPPEFFDSMKKGQIQKGDVLIVKDGATTGKVSFVDDKFPYDKAAVNEHVFILRVNPKKCLQKFMFYYLYSKEGNNKLMKNFKGTAQGGINTKFIYNFKMILPPLETQKKIVAKLDAFFKEYEILKQEKLKAKENYEKILQSAIDKILFPDIMPKHWVTSKLFEVSEKIQYGLTAKSEKEKVGPIYLRITDINSRGKLNSDLRYVNINEEDYSKYLLEEGDIVIARTGATVGKSYLVKKEDKNMVFASYLIRFKISKEIVLPELVFFQLNSLKYWTYIFREQRGIGQPNVNAKKLGNFELYYPPTIQEQEKLITKIKLVSEFIENIEKERNNVTQNIEALPHSVLTKAFRGELIAEIGE